MMRQWKRLINNLKINNMYTLRIGTRNGDVFETENMDLGNSYSVYGKGTKEYASDCYRDWETDRKSTRLNSSHLKLSRMPSSA